MKKVGIITFHEYNNYGTVLQAFALQKKVELMGYDSEIINFRSSLNSLSFFQKVEKRYKVAIKSIQTRKEMKLKKQAFKKFYKEYMKVGNKAYYNIAQLKKDVPEYDVYMAGSDQTWNPYLDIKSEAFFLTFAPKDKIRVSYAPSVGVGFVSPNYSEEMKKRLESVDYLSCREETGAKIISEITGKNVPVVLDPTLLLKPEDWDKVASNYNINEPYILCYFLGEMEHCRNFAKRLSKEKNIPIYYMYATKYDCKDGNKVLNNVGPREFIYLIKNASYICTDSFHGMIFSINYNKSFYTFCKRKEYEGSDNQRIHDALKYFNVEDRFIEDGDKFTGEFKDMDYNHINKDIENKRKISIEYLTHALERE